MLMFMVMLTLLLMMMMSDVINFNLCWILLQTVKALNC
jgi:hypothetical protein